MCKEAHFSNGKSEFGSAELKPGQSEKTPRSSVAPILGEGKHPMEEEKPVAPEDYQVAEPGLDPWIEHRSGD